MSTSSTVAAGDLILASQYNNLRTDVLSTHDHITSGEGSQLIARESKASSETVNGSSTLQNDDDLVVAVGTNQIWEMFLWARYTSGTTPDIKFAWTIPASAVMWRVAFRKSTTYGWVDPTNDSTAIVADGDGATEREYLERVFVTTAGTAGNVQLQWAQNTSDASDTIVLAGSRLLAFRIA